MYDRKVQKLKVYSIRRNTDFAKGFGEYLIFLKAKMNKMSEFKLGIKENDVQFFLLVGTNISFER